MAPVRRRLLNLLTALSVLLCVAVCALWVSSYGHQQVWDVVTARGARWVVSSRGQVGLLWMDVPAGETGWRIERGTDHDDDMRVMVARAMGRGQVRRSGVFESGAVRRPMVAFINLRGVCFRAGEDGREGCPLDYRWIAGPHWALAAAAAVVPAARLVGRVSCRRRRPGLCPQCGYDLRASPERCPECGTAAPAVPGTIPA
jgi:hypothetical protein